MKYAKAYLQEEQIVEVDINAHMTEVLIHLSKLAYKSEGSDSSAVANSNPANNSTKVES